jgi:hypothetical protein
MKKYFCSIILCMASQVANAAWTGDLVIDKAFVENSDLIVLYTSGGSVYKEGCIANNWILRADNEDRRNRMYSTALAAFMSGKKVNLWYDEATCDAWSYHKATSIQILK